MTTFREACKPYFHYGPIMSNEPFKEPDGNGLTYLGHYFSILKKRGELDLSIDREHFLNAIELVQVVPGVFNRSATKKERNTHDDYIGVARAAQILAPEIAEDIYRHGLINDWVYNNTKSENLYTILRSWHWRMPGVVQHYKLCSNHPLTPFDEWYFQVDKIFTNFKPFNATSGRLLDWLKFEAYLDSNYRVPKLDELYDVFAQTIEAKYNQKMGGAYGIYFGEAHPFAQYMKNLT